MKRIMTMVDVFRQENALYDYTVESSGIAMVFLLKGNISSLRIITALQSDTDRHIMMAYYNDVFMYKNELEDIDLLDEMIPFYQPGFGLCDDEPGLYSHKTLEHIHRADVEHYLSKYILDSYKEDNDIKFEFAVGLNDIPF